MIMYCSKCGKEIHYSDAFCKYCGAEQEPNDLDTYTERIKKLRRPTDFLVAKMLYTIHKRELFYQNYSSFADYAKKELNMEKVTAYMYSKVYERFFDFKGNSRINQIEEWSVSNLNELHSLSITDINTLIEKGILTPSLKQKEIREIVKQYTKPEASLASEEYT
jgi:DNA modification methylase